MMEQPSLRFFTFDVDSIRHEVQRTSDHLIAVLKQWSFPQDSEFIQRKGVVQVSRFVPDDALNESFEKKQGTEIKQMSLEEVKLLKLSIERVGRFDRIFFEQIELEPDLKAKAVEVQVKPVGLNAKDFYVLARKVDTKNGTWSLECSGVVERTGSAVSSLAAGDRVVVMAPGKPHRLFPNGLATSFKTMRTSTSYAPFRSCT